MKTSSGEDDQQFFSMVWLSIWCICYGVAGGKGYKLQFFGGSCGGKLWFVEEGKRGELWVVEEGKGGSFTCVGGRQGVFADYKGRWISRVRGMFEGASPWDVLRKGNGEVP